MKPSDMKNSRIMTGWVRHRRYSPKNHDFKYPVFMWYLDIDEITSLSSQSSLVSVNRFNWCNWKRADYFDASSPSLKQSLVKKFSQELNIVEQNIHRVTMLTNLRMLGFLINPVTFYYAFDQHDQLLGIMPEITNTPWNERYQYALDTQNSSGESSEKNKKSKKFRFKLAKDFHISPFHPIDMQYDWQFSEPTRDKQVIHLENWQHNKKVFDATMLLTPEPISNHSIRKSLIRFPLMTVKVAFGIYWNALKLFIKGIPYVQHPHKESKLS